MKRYVVTGVKNGCGVFSFPLNALNGNYAIHYASKDELIRDMEFDKLIIKEVKQWTNVNVKN